MEKSFCSLGAYPDFLLAALDKAACAVFCKENRMKIATPPTSTGNPGQPRNLQFSQAAADAPVHRDLILKQSVGDQELEGQQEICASGTTTGK